MKNILLRSVIIFFCLWHMSAVAIYTIPRESTDRVSIWAREKLLPKVTPYMLQTSQWQLWNLFAPNPLRRVTYYALDTWENGAWQEHTVIRPGTYPFWSHAWHFKMLLALWEENRVDLLPVSEHLAQLQCERFGIAPGQRMRLRYEITVVPYFPAPVGIAAWKQWQPQWENITALETTCPTKSLIPNP